MRDEVCTPADTVTRSKPTAPQSGGHQHDLATRIGSGQSRIAKMESASPDVSLDLICKALLALGVVPKGIGKAIAKARAA